MDTIFLQRMKELLKDQYDDFINALQLEPIKGFYLNPLKKDVLKYLNNDYITKHPYIEDGYYFDYTNYRLGKLPYFNCGLYYIQEPSAMVVGSLLDIQKDDYVLDMCGAPGGKTCYIASRLSKQGLMIANDINHLRSTILSQNVERFGLQNTIVTNCDPVKLPTVFTNYFDKIILDAPCSGEGMFRKLEQAVDTWSLEKVQECAYIQKQLLDAAYTMLKPDGILVYSTCTYSLEENEENVNYCINELQMKSICIPKQEGMSFGINNKDVVRLYPHINHGEGQFIALLKKEDQCSPSKVTTLKANCTNEQYTLVKKFYQENLTIHVPPYLYASNNHIYAIQPHFPLMNKIRIVKNGLYLGECKKGRFEPSLSLALTLTKESVKRYYEFSVDDKEIEQYLQGQTLVGYQEKGYGVLFVDGYPLSFYKESNQQVKNLYPKGLRR